MATAMDHLVKATELLPRDERFRFRLGFAWQLNGEMEKAVLEYARAVALEGPNLALSRQYLDQAYEAVHGNRRNVDRLVAEQKRYLRELPAN
jgi:tetratricopeptide (TPR) repeat protein